MKIKSQNMFFKVLVYKGSKKIFKGVFASKNRKIWGILKVLSQFNQSF